MIKINQIKINLDVVICTHKGNSKLAKTIISILKSTYLPNKIIVVGTNSNDFIKINKLKKFIDLELIISPIPNQVKQRLLGFKYVTSKYIMQSDDDLLFKKNTIEKFYNEIIKDDHKKIYSGTLYINTTHTSDYRWIKNYNKFKLFRGILFTLNFFKKVKAGNVILSGRAIPDIGANHKREWLNSCLFFNAKFLKDYVGLECEGKAFYEDVYTTHNFYKLGYLLVKIDNAIIIHPEKNEFTFKEHRDSLSNQYKIVKKFKKSKILFIIDVIIFSLIFGLKSI